ncbi:MAG: DUF4249 family protein [Planctomycetia bacterium]|nr:DUF4249 family protein [Planctomycetia bacterium]
MNYIKILLFTIIVVLLTNCEKTITINLNTYETQLSVECILKPNETPQLSLSNTVAYFDTLVANQDIFVDNAIVTISNAQKVDTLKVMNIFNYYLCQDEYYYQGSIPIQQGDSYHLRIEHEGNLYEADAVMNVPAVQIDSVSFVNSFKDLFGEHEGVVVSFTDLPNQENYYRYQMNRMLNFSMDTLLTCANGPYSASEIGRSIFSDRNIDGAKLTIVIEPVYDHVEGDSALIFIQSLDSNAARFYDDLDRQKNSKVNPFIEPVFIRSNIPGAFGIFASSNYSQPFEFVYPKEQ